MLLRNCFVFVLCVWSFFESFYQVSGNGHHNIEFRFVGFEHVEFCLESAIHDISCYMIGNHGRKILL